MSDSRAVASLRKRKQMRIQAATYFVAGLGTMAFMALYLGPKAEAERHALASLGLPSNHTAAAPTTSVRLAGESKVAATASGPAATPTAQPPAEPAASTAEPAPTAAAPAPTAAEPAPTAAEPAPAAAEPAPTAAEPAPAAAAPAPAAAEPPPPPGPLPATLLVTRFSTGSPALGRAQLEQVQRAAKRLLEDPTLHATVRGHADRRGSDLENTPLSEQRAAAVAEALRTMGIAAKRLEIVGAGSQVPVDPADSSTAFARNRRVEILFTRKDPP